MSGYKSKHLINQGAPDGFDLDNCPVYQAYLKQCDEDRLKDQMKDQLNQDIESYYSECVQ